MRVRNILLTIGAVSVIACTGLIYVGSLDNTSKDNSVTKEKTSTTSKKTALESSSSSTTSSSSTSELALSSSSNSLESESSSSSTSDKDVASSKAYDDEYGYVLLFTDGSRRLSKNPPTGNYWQQGTSSPATNEHIGRTTYNQVPLGGMGGAAATPEGVAKLQEEFDKAKQSYDTEIQNEINNSVPYYD